MKISIALQTLVFLQAVLLGAVLGAVYDMLRAVRRTLRAGIGATALCDSLFWLTALGALFVFVLAAAQGEGRAYILLGCVLGGVLYFLTCSPLLLALACGLLQSVVKTGRYVHNLWKKARAAVQCAKNTDKPHKKTEKNLKKHFLFFRK